MHLFFGRPRLRAAGADLDFDLVLDCAARVTLVSWGIGWIGECTRHGELFHTVCIIYMISAHTQARVARYGRVLGLEGIRLASRELTGGLK